MKRISLAVALALAVVACALPAKPPVVTPSLRPLAVHTCVAGATVWLDGAQVPALTDVADANGNVTFPRLPATLSAFNLHATAATMPEYGTVITMTPSTDPLVIILGSCAK